MSLGTVLLAICLSLGHCHYDAYDDNQNPYSSRNNFRKRKDHELEFNVEWADIEDFPSTVLLELTHFVTAEDEVYRRSWCGGSIINLKWVVTAAHCLECCPGINDKFITINGSVYAGSSNRSDIGMVQDLVEYVIPVHSEHVYTYTQTYPVNDIGLVQVEFYFPLGQLSIESAPLPETNQVLPPGSTVTAAGWGFPLLSNTPADGMMKFTMVVMDPQQCYEELGMETHGSEFCTRLVKKDMLRNVSFGDTGSPVYMEDGMVVGVISWIHSGENNEEVIIITNIAFLRDWIRNIAAV